VLMQDFHVEAYASRWLMDHEEHYLTHDLDLAYVVHALKVWRYYLMKKRCELYTNHMSLKYTFMQPNLSLGPRRWLELIEDYDLGINYHLRKANVVADAWSQRPHVSQLVAKNKPFKLCKEFNKLNLRIVANAEIMEMEANSALV
jgi:hypothetical protein